MLYRVFIFGLLILLSCNSNLSAAQQAPFPSYKIQEVASGLNFPWSLAFLPDGSLLVTERTGKLARISNDKVYAPITGLPTDIYVKGQGGLLEVVLHPNFASNNWVYISYAMGNDDQNALRVMQKINR